MLGPKIELTSDMWLKSVSIRLIDLLGEGSQGAVYRAKRVDPSSGLEQIVVAKVLHSRNEVDAWKQEFESLSRMNSPYCVKVLSFERIQGRPALLLEYIDGLSLYDLISAASFSIEQAHEIIAQIENGLRDLAAHGIFHGDLSPKNIMVSRTGRVVLLDFGLANSIGQRFTPAFASPERVAGEPASFLSDLYSLKKIELLLLGRHSAFSEDDLSASIQERRWPCRPTIQCQLGQHVSEIIDQRKLWGSLKTKTHALIKSKGRSHQRLTALALSCVALMIAPKPVRSLSVGKASVLSVSTLEWTLIQVDGREVGYAPFSIPLDPSVAHSLEWLTARGKGKSILKLKPGQSLILQDRDFSH